MNTRRVIAAVFFSIVIVSVLVILVIQERLNSSQTVTAFVMQTNVTAGAIYKNQDIQQISVTAAPNSFTYETSPPSQDKARYAVSLQKGDILRPDDLIPLAEQSLVSVNLAVSPPLSPGSSVDVYYVPTGQQSGVTSSNSLVIGQNLTVYSVSGTTAVLLVCASDEPYWAAIGGASTPLTAAQPLGGRIAISCPGRLGPLIPTISAADAITALNQEVIQYGTPVSSTSAGGINSPPTSSSG